MKSKTALIESQNPESRKSRNEEFLSRDSLTADIHMYKKKVVLRIKTPYVGGAKKHWDVLG
jgi:hypothetical protein